MMIIIPAISSNQIVFGIYSVCISTVIFLSYADIGFMSAGYKYAGECYAKGDIEHEVKIFGFTSFILFIFISIIFCFYILFAIYPSLLISNISDKQNLGIASSLLLIQAIFSYNVFLRKLVEGIFIVRIENYIIQKIDIAGSLITISSIFYFFSPGRYEIVNYFLLLNLVKFFAVLIGLIIIKKRYNYNYLSLIKAFKYDKLIFKETKGLAFSSLFVTLMWIIYYELDIVAIGYYLGAASVAIYSVAFTFMKFFRSLFSIIFTPFQARYNHFVGLKDYSGLRIFLMNVIKITMPIIVFTVLSVLFLKKNIILTWVGPLYEDSILILLLLGANALFAFIIIPTANVIVSLEKIKSMYSINIVMSTVFWIGIFMSINLLGVYSFAVFKLVSGIVAFIMYLKLLINFLEINFCKFVKETILKILLPMIIQATLLYTVISYLPDTKNNLNLIVVVAAGGIITFISLVILMLTSSDYKNIFKIYYSKLVGVN